jgi:predicted PurR-regulated permease PerM
VSLQDETHNQDRAYIHRAVEVSIHLALLTLLAVACLLILRPFVPLIIWGIIIAIAVYPAYSKLRTLLGGRHVLAAVISTILLLAVLIVPVVLLTGSLVEGMQTLATRLAKESSLIPPPPPSIKTWPVIGVPLAETWELASKNIAATLRTFAPQLKTIIPELLRASAGVGFAVLEWILSILIAGVLLANAKTGASVARSLSNRLFGDRGGEFEQLAAATVRSVTTGILGVALIQTIFAALGFLVAGLPGAGLWAAAFLLAAVLQVGVVVLIPAGIYMFAIASTTKAVAFLIWCLFVGLMDNVLKPLLLGRGIAVPLAVVFLGAIGGFIAMGTIGMFVGPILLSVGYKLFLAWLEGALETTSDAQIGTGASTQSVAAD